MAKKSEMERNRDIGIEANKRMEDYEYSVDDSGNDPMVGLMASFKVNIDEAFKNRMNGDW